VQSTGAEMLSASAEVMSAGAEILLCQEDAVS
jgi:hypothetical protein